MRQLVKNETLFVLLSAILITSILVMPFIGDISQAQTVNTNALIVSHQPVKIGYKGRPLSITAHINDETGIRNVSLVVNYGGNSKTGNIPELTAEGIVPVLAQVTRDTKVYSGASTRNKVKGKVYAGEILNVTKVKDGFYRIITDGGLNGYVTSTDLRTQKTGKAFGVSIPATMTSEPFITYQIVATDMTGNTAKTKVNKVTLYTQEELAAMRTPGNAPTPTAVSGDETEAAPASSSKLWLLAGLAAVGGGAYYIISQQSDDDDKDKNLPATVDVTIEWE
ncbi:MAG TPA: SH3 domain-containing protein [bacterium]|nr:SH3 domain-containing protein [bacterium]HPN44653.1 SH3 domain-containing protein [bacterium]